MQTVLSIDARVIGRRNPIFDGVNIPVDLVGRVTLGDLIRRIVLAEVEAFQRRQEERRLVRFLTAEQIAEGAAHGKIEMGAAEIPPQTVDAQAAVATALEAFRDGIYLAFIDGRQVQQLDAELQLQPETRVSFVRLTMLAGG